MLQFLAGVTASYDCSIVVVTSRFQQQPWIYVCSNQVVAGQQACDAIGSEVPISHIIAYAGLILCPQAPKAFSLQGSLATDLA